MITRAELEREERCRGAKEKRKKRIRAFEKKEVKKVILKVNFVLTEANYEILMK